MRSLLLSAILGVATLGWMAVAPAQIRADSDSGLDRGDTVRVDWDDYGRPGWRQYGYWHNPGWWAASPLYTPGYSAYYYPGYVNPYLSGYYNPYASGYYNYYWQSPYGYTRYFGTPYQHYYWTWRY